MNEIREPNSSENNYLLLLDQNPANTQFFFENSNVSFIICLDLHVSRPRSKR